MWVSLMLNTCSTINSLLRQTAVLNRIFGLFWVTSLWYLAVIKLTTWCLLVAKEQKLIPVMSCLLRTFARSLRLPHTINALIQSMDLKQQFWQCSQEDWPHFCQHSLEDPPELSGSLEWRVLLQWSQIDCDPSSPLQIPCPMSDYPRTFHLDSQREKCVQGLTVAISNCFKAFGYLQPHIIWCSCRVYNFTSHVIWLVIWTCNHLRCKGFQHYWDATIAYQEFCWGDWKLFLVGTLTISMDMGSIMTLVPNLPSRSNLLYWQKLGMWSP